MRREEVLRALEGSPESFLATIKSHVSPPNFQGSRGKFFVALSLRGVVWT